MEACGEERQVKLLGALWSPFVLRVRIALALKGIDYEFIEDNLQPKSELLLKSNPVHKRIPVLIHNGKPVCESMIIVQYIEEAWNKAPILMPKDPYDRATARFWAAFIDDKLVPSLRGVFTGQGEQQQKALEESVANLVVLEEALRTSPCFSGKLYFGGDEIGFVDIALAGVSAFVKALEKITNSDSVLIDMPLLSAWIDRICEDNRVKEITLDLAKVQESIAVLLAIR
uniref:glutathione transferase n=1 Tax=Pinus tabuliformis TaxID=88731 RepID=L7S6F1_PINTB|nr:tau class glutathione S-transferase [Pinus tabuliformis]